MKQMQAVSIVVPTLNEAENIPHLLSRIDTPMRKASIPYEVIIIDDHSSDQTVQVANSLANDFPVRVSVKHGKRGKAYSLIQGFSEAKHPLVLMIDADLQYPPEEIMPMYNLLKKTNADIVTTRRSDQQTTWFRQLSSKTYNLIFAKLLFGINFDTQSGLKLFKKHILTHFEMNPSPWSFDLEFLVRALENKFKIISHDIPFGEREAGVTKIKLFSSTIELARAALKLRWHTSRAKTRAGHRANVQFLKRTLPSAVLVFLLTFIISSGGHSAQALDVSSVLNNSLQGITSIIDSPVNQNATSTPPIIQSVTSTSPDASSTNSSTTNPPTSSIMSQALNQQAGSLSPSNPTNTTPTWLSTTESTTIPAKQNTTSSIALVSDLNNFSAVTASDVAKNIYATGYPNYKLSASSLQSLRKGTYIAIVIGGLCLLSAAAFARVKFYRNRKQSVNIRI